MLDNVRFWLDKGVDGLRLDAINFCFHDPQLRDNPPKPVEQRIGARLQSRQSVRVSSTTITTTRSRRTCSSSNELRALLDDYPGTAALGEISSEDSLATMAEYTSERSPAHGVQLRAAVGRFVCGAHSRDGRHARRPNVGGLAVLGAVQSRRASRGHALGRRAAAPATLPNQLLAMLCSLRGSVCLYQGEELGLPEAELPFEALHDPYGIAFWPNFKGRDGCRTPMPWDESEHGGFSAATPWLPVPQEHRAMCVARQDADRQSTLNAFRAFMRWRKTMPALMWGAIRVIAVAETVFAFERSYGDKKVLAAFNLSAHAVDARAPELEALAPGRRHGTARRRACERPIALACTRRCIRDTAEGDMMRSNMYRTRAFICALFASLVVAALQRHCLPAPQMPATAGPRRAKAPTGSATQ